jgi:hypothetical protein
MKKKKKTKNHDSCARVAGWLFGNVRGAGLCWIPTDTTPSTDWERVTASGVAWAAVLPGATVGVAEATGIVLGGAATGTATSTKLSAEIPSRRGNEPWPAQGNVFCFCLSSIGAN